MLVCCTLHDFSKHISAMRMRYRTKFTECSEEMIVTSLMRNSWIKMTHGPLIHELLIKTAEAAANKYNIDFLYRDFRPYFKEGQEKARELELYMQKYCGCVFSEEDRYTKRK